MWPLLPLPETALVSAAMLVISVGSLALYDASIFRNRLVVTLAVGIHGSIALGLVSWQFGTPLLAWHGVTLSWTLIIVCAPLALSVPFAILVHALLKRSLRARALLLKVRKHLPWYRSRAREVSEPVYQKEEIESPARRALLRGAVTALPASAVLASSRGLAQGDEPARIVHVPMHFPDLPESLRGFRILHLSDLHLGSGRTVAELKEVLARARAEKPNLIVLTGDVADRLEELREGLAAIAEFGAPCGVYAALGNHEYLSDIDKTLPIYEQSQLRLLRDASECVRVGDASLFIAGVDDPIFKGPPRRIFERSVSECVATAPPEAFKLLLCHRPEGFEAATRAGFDLTLSGHTHGGQIGLLGKSAFEVLLGAKYMWGSYQRQRSRLYTTSGFGHWFPFRLNCPAEAPIIVLEKG